MHANVIYENPLSSDRPSSSSDHLRCCHHDGRTAEGRLICRWTGIIGETGDGRTDDSHETRGGSVSRFDGAVAVWSDSDGQSSRMFWEGDVKQTPHQFAPRRICSHYSGKKRNFYFRERNDGDAMAQSNPRFELGPFNRLMFLRLEHAGTKKHGQPRPA